MKFNKFPIITVSHNMPIKPQNKNLYPNDWKWISAQIRYGRAKNQCEKCGIKNGNKIEGKKGKIILTVAHLDQDPTNNSFTNLSALCQKCHFSHDKRENLKKRIITQSIKYSSQQILNL